MTRNLTTTLDQEISLLKKYTQVLSKIVFLSKGISFLEGLKRKARVTGISMPLIENIKEDELKKEDVQLLLKEASTLVPEVQKIYESYRVELGLGDYSNFLDCIYLFAPDVIEKGHSPIVITNDLICKLEGLKYKREREAETPAPQPGQEEGKDTKTPTPQEGKEAAPWWKRVGRYFVRNHKWLIAAIIVPTVAPIIVLLVKKKLGD